MGKYYEFESIKNKVLTSEIDVIETFIDEYSVGSNPYNDFFRKTESEIRSDLYLKTSIYDRLNRMIKKRILNRKKVNNIYLYSLTEKGKKIARAYIKETGL